ncbi:MAG: 6-phosphofructokinase [Planctomycetes bacterium]|nr:6-phosphofructokinase [Planctomycetota bacterium]
MSQQQRGTFGILVGGGPAPGINGVIGAVAIAARNHGYRALGIYDGFSHLMKGKTDQVVELQVEDVSRIHFHGGSILRTSRANPTKDPENLKRTVAALQQLGVTHLVVIGGDDTAFSAAEVGKASGGNIHIAHVPKTIDNDLPLPGRFSTFGFQTARHYGADVVKHLMEDSITTTRWYFVVSMGRQAGHLAQGIGYAAGATVTVIPEEFSASIRLREVVDILECSILKRMANGRQDGVAVLAEGIAERIDPEALESLEGSHVERDEHGHIRLAEIDLAGALQKAVQLRFHERGQKVTIVSKDLGYELRCAAPIGFDVAYTRTLGWNAARYLMSLPPDQPSDAVMIYTIEGSLEFKKLEEMRDPKTRRMSVRPVDVNSELSRAARCFQIRLERADLENPTMLGKLAQLAQMTPEQFTERYGYLCGL